MPNPREYYGSLNINNYKSTVEVEWILIPGKKSKNKTYQSIYDNKKVKMHPFVVANIDLTKNIEYLLLPLTSKKPLRKYKNWTCNCGNEHHNIYVWKDINILLYDIGKSSRTKSISFIKLTHEYTIIWSLLSNLIAEQILYPKEKIESSFVKDINSFKVKEEKCLANFKRSGNFLLNYI